MATDTEIQTALRTIAGARLRNAPTQTEIPDTITTWKRLFADIPGPLLTRAADDIAMTAAYWPTPKEMRAAAYQVQVHNNTSAAPNQFAPLQAGKPDGYLNGEGVRINSHQPFVVVTADGWLPWKAGSVQRATFPAAVQAEIDRLGRLDTLTDAELAQIDALTAPYRGIL